MFNLHAASISGIDLLKDKSKLDEMLYSYRIIDKISKNNEYVG